MELGNTKLERNNWHGVMSTKGAHVIVAGCTITDNRLNGVEISFGGTADISTTMIHGSEDGVNAALEPGEIELRANTSSSNRGYGYVVPG